MPKHSFTVNFSLMQLRNSKWTRIVQSIDNKKAAHTSVFTVFSNSADKIIILNNYEINDLMKVSLSLTKADFLKEIIIRFIPSEVDWRIKDVFNGQWLFMFLFRRRKNNPDGRFLTLIIVGVMMMVFIFILIHDILIGTPKILRLRTPFVVHFSYLR